MKRLFVVEQQLDNKRKKKKRNRDYCADFTVRHRPPQVNGLVLDRHLFPPLPLAHAQHLLPTLPRMEEEGSEEEEGQADSGGEEKEKEEQGQGQE